jgi:nucleotide-binding universal stress UspA family protein
MLEKILVPLDGSELGEITLAYAGELAIALGSEVQMVCATERHDAETRHMCSLYLNKLAERLYTRVKRGNPVAEVKTVVVNGEAAEILLEHAEKEKINLIVLSSHGHSGFIPRTIGSNASKIIQKSQIPVLLVRASKGTIKRRSAGLFQKIIVPLDGSPMGEAALPYVIEIAKAFKSTVIILRVVETEQRVHTIGGTDHFLYNENLIEQMKTEASIYLSRIHKKLGKNITVQTVMRTGDAAREIIKLSDEESGNIVAMSSHGKSGLTRWVLGSTSSKILQAGKTPLLLVRPKPA